MGHRVIFIVEEKKDTSIHLKERYDSKVSPSVLKNKTMSIRCTASQLLTHFIHMLSAVRGHQQNILKHIYYFFLF